IRKYSIPVVFSEAEPGKLIESAGLDEQTSAPAARHRIGMARSPQEQVRLMDMHVTFSGQRYRVKLDSPISHLAPGAGYARNLRVPPLAGPAVRCLSPTRLSVMNGACVIPEEVQETLEG
ncbi:MAG: hypothetical protein L0Z53_18025, partial [Acidobacteriales bacterium]|nr:hypothetical protein [Terriglobales bacterium]